MINRSQRAAVIILRLIGIGGLCAVPAIVMPFSWMESVHRVAGLGDLPDVPIVSYLARSLSAFYAVVGLISLSISFDLSRYRPLARLLALTFVLMGVVLLGVDLATGMPQSWTLSEGPPSIAIGVLLLWLLSRAPSVQEAGNQGTRMSQDGSRSPVDS